MEGTERWTIRPYREGDEHGILRLFNEVFAVGNPDFVPRSLEQWRWQFQENPCGHQTLVAEVEGRIVGQYTALPTWWRLRGGVALGAQALDTCVAAEFRGSLKKSGLFLTLAGEWFDTHGREDLDRIVYGFPNPQAFRIGTRRVGYLPVHCPVPESVLPVAAAASFREEGILVEPVAEFGAEVDDFDVHLAPYLGMPAVRDHRYLNWRYARRPGVRYGLLRAESPGGALRGFLVYTLGWHGDRKNIAPLVDWMIEPGDLPVWRAFLGEVGRQARARRLDELLAWVPPLHAQRGDLEALGFRTQDSRFNLCIRIFTPAFDLQYAIERWWVVMGDSDIY